MIVSEPIQLPPDKEYEPKYLIALNLDAKQKELTEIDSVDCSIEPGGYKAYFRNEDGHWLGEVILDNPQGAVTRVRIELRNGQALNCCLDLDKEREGIFDVANEDPDNDHEKDKNMDLIEQRIKALADSMKQDMDLIKEYEDALRRADDPRKRLNCRWNIDELRKSVEQHQQEYNALTKETKDRQSDKLPIIGKELSKMHTKLDQLLIGQQDIRDDISELKSDIITRFEANEQKIISTVLDRLEQNELFMVSTVLNGIDTVSVAVSNIEETLVSVREALIEVHGQGDGIEDTVLAQVVGETLEVVDDPKLDFKHRLKVTIPIIPLIINYERIIELKSSVNLKKAWEWLRNRFGS